jgi:hypothetical protein
MNLHLIKSLKNGLELPTLNIKFFLQCTKAVVENIESTIINPYLLKSLNEFKNLRPTLNYQFIEYNQCIEHIIDLMAKQ